MMDFEPYFRSPTANRSVQHIRLLYATDGTAQAEVGSIINSSAFFWWFFAVGNCRKLTLEDACGFRLSGLGVDERAKLVVLFKRLMANFKKNSANKHRGESEFQEFDWAKAKPVVDEIDCVLARGFGLDGQITNFVLNHDIKIRMDDVTHSSDD